MQLTDIKATREQFIASINIDTFDDLCNVLSYLSENTELVVQLVNACGDAFPYIEFNKQFNHVYFDNAALFGDSRSAVIIDVMLLRMREYIAPRTLVSGFEDFDINFSAIKRLAGLGVAVSVSFSGEADTDKEEDTRTSVSVTFAVVQYPTAFNIAC